MEILVEDLEIPENFYRRLFFLQKLKSLGFPLENDNFSCPFEFKKSKKIYPLPATAPCIVKILESSFEKGMRNECTFALARFLRKYGFPIDDAARIIGLWNAHNIPPLPVKEVVNTIMSAYQKEYSISCDDYILRKFCNPKVCNKSSHEKFKPLLKYLLQKLVISTL